MIIIGEKINGTRKQVAEAIRNRDADFIRQLAQRQFESGASYLDINAGSLPQREPEDMVWLVENVQQAVPESTISLDSANRVALKAGIEKAAKTPMINSLSGEKFRIEGVLPLACEFQTELVVLALDDNGIPKTSEGRLDIVRRLVEMTRKGGLPDEKLFVDPLVMAISTGNGEWEYHYGDMPQASGGISQGPSDLRLVQHLFRHASSANTESGVHGPCHTGGDGQHDYQPGRSGTALNHDGGRNARWQGPSLHEFQPRFPGGKIGPKVDL